MLESTIPVCSRAAMKVSELNSLQTLFDNYLFDVSAHTPPAYAAAQYHQVVALRIVEIVTLLGARDGLDFLAHHYLPALDEHAVARLQRRQTQIAYERTEPRARPLEPSRLLSFSRNVPALAIQI